MVWRSGRARAGVSTRTTATPVTLLALVMLSALVADLPAGESAKAGAAPTAVLAYNGTTGDRDGVATATLDGVELHRFTRRIEYVDQFTTINGGLVAVTKRRLVRFLASDLFIYDATTGALDQKIKDARFGLVVADGSGVVFLPDNFGFSRVERDPTAMSVWYRDLGTETDTKLTQFRRPDRHVMSLAASPSGDLFAFTRGNDQFLFKWDIWLVDLTGTRRKLTDGGRSLSPSFSPDGQTIAFERQRGDVPCSGGLATIGIDGTGQHRFYTNTCRRNLNRPVWLGPRRVVAWWWDYNTRRGGRPQGLVILNVETGWVSRPIVEGHVMDFSVSRELRTIAFRLETGALGTYDLDTRATTMIPNGEEFPGWHVHLDGSHEL